MAPPVTMTIAGSDSGGGAGIQADLKAMAFAGVHGVSAITALTAQNSEGVEDIHGIPPEFVEKQIKTVTSDMAVRSTKTGMPFSRPIIETVVELRDNYGKLVVDPVMVSATGDRLLQQEAEEVLVNSLLPKATIITPNVQEARIIAEHLGVEPSEDRSRFARDLAEELDGPGVLLKGGHDPGSRAVDYLARTDEEMFSVDSPWIDTDNTHGSGCAFSSLIAAHLARIATTETAIQRAKIQLTEAIKRNYSPGSGIGTLNFLNPESMKEIDAVGTLQEALEFNR